MSELTYLREQIEQLQRELEAAKKDADRYRWLREKLAFSYDYSHRTYYWRFPGVLELDEAIDAALAREGQNTPVQCGPERPVDKSGHP